MNEAQLVTLKKGRKNVFREPAAPYAVNGGFQDKKA